VRPFDKHIPCEDRAIYKSAKSRSAEGGSPLTEREGSSPHSFLLAAEGGKIELVNRPVVRMRDILSVWTYGKMAGGQRKPLFTVVVFYFLRDGLRKEKATCRKSR
jgi:hypothetical protein